MLGASEDISSINGDVYLFENLYAEYAVPIYSFMMGL